MCPCREGEGGHSLTGDHVCAYRHLNMSHGEEMDNNGVPGVHGAEGTSAVSPLSSSSPHLALAHCSPCLSGPHRRHWIPQSLFPTVQPPCHYQVHPSMWDELYSEPFSVASILARTSPENCTAIRRTLENHPSDGKGEMESVTRWQESSATPLPNCHESLNFFLIWWGVFGG